MTAARIWVTALVGLALGGLVARASAHQEGSAGTVITPLLEQPLPVRESAAAGMITVEYAPGAGTPPHTHPADTFVYVRKALLRCRSQAAN